jgi:hypothetical protein
VRLHRDFQGETPKGGHRSEISSFTTGSKRRLRWAASNASPSLVSQFGMTYHHSTPDGYEVKRQLNLFLTLLRKKFPGVGYLWILEFQKRESPHIHLWLTLPVDTPELKYHLAITWHRIAEPESIDHLACAFHEKNFIAWEMGGGSYLCKYLDKDHQKRVPDGFCGIGRFWGASRGLVPPPDVVELSQIANPVSFVRTLGRHHEKSLRRSKWKSRARRSPCSFRLPNGAKVANRLLEEQTHEEGIGSSANRLDGQGRGEILFPPQDESGICEDCLVSRSRSEVQRDFPTGRRTGHLISNRGSSSNQPIMPGGLAGSR